MSIRDIVPRRRSEPAGQQDDWFPLSSLRREMDRPFGYRPCIVADPLGSGRANATAPQNTVLA
jgi:hypothetical protein